LQGNVSCFLSSEVSYQISVPLALPPGEDSINIKELNVRTNYTNPAFIDFTPMVSGTVLGPNSPPLEVSFEATINLAIPQAYETILFVSGETVNTKQVCEGADYNVFFAPSNEAPGAVPAPSPTVATLPTVSGPTTGTSKKTAPSPTVATLPTVSGPTTGTSKKTTGKNDSSRLIWSYTHL
jgi:hypothetical protein